MFRILLFLLSLTLLNLKVNAQVDSKNEISKILDAWHQAAATADADVFFGTMTEGCIYLGTDQSERWLRDSLKYWSSKYFDRESAWSFKPYQRNIVLHASGEYAMFDELLETWMGSCRGSGVVQFIDGEWKIAYYNLGVTISNDLVKGFIELVEQDPNNRFYKKKK